MAINAGPKIVEDGLILCLDAANKKSYPRTGTVWTDLTANKNNAILVNMGSLNFRNDGVGSLIFDGTDEYMYITKLNYGASSDNGTISELTVLCWIKTSYNTGNNRDDGSIETNNWAFLDFDRSEVFNLSVEGGGQLKFAGKSANNGGFSEFYDLGAGTHSSRLVNDGNWHQVGVTFSVAAQKIIFFIDGVMIRSVSANGNMTALGSGVRRYGIIGDGSEADTVNGARNYIYYQGQIASILMYDSKSLTSAQIKQHYLATKGRFQ